MEECKLQADVGCSREWARGWSSSGRSLGLRLFERQAATSSFASLGGLENKEAQITQYTNNIALQPTHLTLLYYSDTRTSTKL